MEPVKKNQLLTKYTPIRTGHAPVHFRLADQRDLQEIGRLRYRVWREEGVYVPDFEGSEQGVWLDDLDKQATHFIAECDGEVIAAARLSFHQNLATIPDIEWLDPLKFRLHGTVISLNRLVVAKNFRGLGIARQLDVHRMEYGYDHGAQSAVVIGVGLHRVKAIESLGFKFSHYLPRGNGLMEPEYPLGALYLPFTSKQH